MKQLCFATNNAHKLEEIRTILANKLEVVSLKDIGCLEDIPETADTLEGNSLLKAQYIVDKYGIDCFADDSGLEVDALNNQPGVFSARYAGPQRNDQDNMQLVLSQLKGIENRAARFKTVITLILNRAMHQFTGTVQGIITTSPAGSNGFGYDPIFIPDGHNRTFAQMLASKKNSLSHRARAVAQLIDFLTTKSGF